MWIVRWVRDGGSVEKGLVNFEGNDGRGGFIEEKFLKDKLSLK